MINRWFRFFDFTIIKYNVDLFFQNRETTLYILLLRKEIRTPANTSVPPLIKSNHPFHAKYLETPISDPDLPKPYSNGNRRREAGRERKKETRVWKRRRAKGPRRVSKSSPRPCRRGRRVSPRRGSFSITSLEIHRSIDQLGPRYSWPMTKITRHRPIVIGSRKTYRVRTSPLKQQ